MSEQPTTAEVANPRRFGLWVAVVAGPTAWAVHLIAGILLVPLACGMANPLVFHLSALAMAGVTVGALVTLVRARDPDRLPVNRQLHGFLVLFGILIAGISLTLIIADWLPVVFIDPCL